MLEHFGRRAEALKLLEICLAERWEGLGLDLGSGLAGIGLNLRHFAERTGESTFRTAAIRAAEIAADRLGAVTDVAETSGGDHPYAGLFEGSSGTALLFIRMFEDTGDAAWLDHAATALDQDLRRCVRRPDGTLHVNEGWRTVPYLTVVVRGSASCSRSTSRTGEDERFRQAADDISHGVRSPFTVQSGLFNGRAGLLAHLAWHSRQAARGPTRMWRSRSGTWGGTRCPTRGTSPSLVISLSALYGSRHRNGGCAAGLGPRCTTEPVHCRSFRGVPTKAPARTSP